MSNVPASKEEGGLRGGGKVEGGEASSTSGTVAGIGAGIGAGAGAWDHPVLKGLKRLGLWLLFGMETVGEVVANVLGLNESKFQYVIDQMSEEDWAIAKEVHEKRLIEEANKAKEGDLEGAVTSEPIEEKIERMKPNFLVMQEK